MIMLILGILSLLQAVFLPGFILTHFFPIPSKATRLLLGVPFSILLNHYLVIGLTLVGLYQQEVVLSILGIELLAIAFLYRRKFPQKSVEQNERSSLLRFSAENPRAVLVSILYLLILYAAISTCVKYTQYWFQDLGSIFTMWDAVVSWNEWARQWGRNSFAGGMGLYPQALPILFSIPYAFLGADNLQFFSKAVSGLIFLAALFCLLDLARKRERDRSLFLLTTYFYGVLQAKFFQSHWNSGYADLPLSAFTIFTLYALLALPAKTKIYVAAIVAGTAPLIKQPGLMLAGIFPVVALLLEHKKFSLLLCKQMLRPAVLSTAMFLPWYGYISWATWIKKSEKNNTGFLAALVDRDFFGRWEWTMELLRSYASAYYLLAVALLTLWGLRHRIARIYALAFGIPYFFIWGTFFSYDVRNFAMAIFPLCLAAMAGLNSFLPNFQSLTPIMWPWKVRYWKAGVTASLLALGSFTLIKRLPPHLLQVRELEQELLLGDDPKANELLFHYLQENPGTGFVAASNQWFAANRLFRSKISALSGCSLEELQRISMARDITHVLFDKSACEPRDLGWKKLFETERSAFYKVGRTTYLR